ncbi:MAG: fructose-bisphosphate aldolase class I [Parcubacteria group bacterium CG11_big_fil_rev_8_21_14_0_20_39_22]|nr:MAG: fructose-bisphosphate aldolase class I [Parcubacteria group bacterium CG11_big_fil_rev_8_21_14_0_20_39_22]
MSIQNIARDLVASGKGILAADESNGTANKRFEALSIPQTFEMRRRWRELLFTTLGIETGISGVILYDETIRQRSDDGIYLSKLLYDKGILVGIKVDEGTDNLPNFPGEKITKGLDNLEERLYEYKEMGASFTKWRAVISIGEDLPTNEAIEANAYLLSQYSALSQKVGLVPIVEPEVLMEGSHSMARCKEVTENAHKILFEYLKKYRVDLSGLILKSNMVLPGKDSDEKVSPKDVAEATLSVFKNAVPHDVPGIVFLSGGQSAIDATLNLNEIAKMGPQPWEVTFSYSRALQSPVMEVWRGNDVNAERAQEVFKMRIKETVAASGGKYQGK